MTDRELLEFAAKAAGVEGSYLQCFVDTFTAPSIGLTDRDFWNPLIDDGDALRLAVKLHIDIRFVSPSYEKYWNVRAEPRSFHNMATEVGYDENSATRRAIVRAAAEIGRSMP